MHNDFMIIHEHSVIDTDSAFLFTSEFEYLFFNICLRSILILYKNNKTTQTHKKKTKA